MDFCHGLADGALPLRNLHMLSGHELAVALVPVEDIEVTRTGFDVDVSGPLDSIAGWIGVDIEDLVWEELREHGRSREELGVQIVTNVLRMVASDAI